MAEAGSNITFFLTTAYFSLQEMTFLTPSQFLLALLAIYFAMESISANDYCNVAANNIMCKFKVVRNI